MADTTPKDDKPAADPAAKPDETAAVKADAKSDAKPDKAGKGKESMHIRVASPFKVFYDDQAVSLSGINATGPFDILPRHHNFISLLDECELAIRTESGTTRVRISGGIMHVKSDQVVVFLNV